MKYLSIIFIFIFAISTHAATFTVTRIDDRNLVCNSGVDCSLREAVNAANAAITDDVIEFEANIFSTAQSITLDGDELRFSANFGTLTINGTGADTLTIDGDSRSRVFFILPGAAVTINDLTVANGNGSGLSLISFSGFGGGIYNRGNLAINRSIIRNNWATHGGGIYNPSILNIKDSTLFQNMTSQNGITRINGSGGAIFNSGISMITNSTIAGNLAGSGGGIDNVNGATTSLMNATIAGNAGFRIGGIGNSLGSTVTAQNTIIANNTAPVTTPPSTAPDFDGELTSQGFNLIENTERMTVTGTTTGNILGQDPLLDSNLRNNGGQTLTLALLPGSPAINAGNNETASATDQRGFARVSGGTIDIGAFELTQAKSRKRVRFF
jgi:CSLREA domain-containing protein